MQVPADPRREPAGPTEPGTFTFSNSSRMKEIGQNNLKQLKYIFIIPGPKSNHVARTRASSHEAGGTTSARRGWEAAGTQLSCHLVNAAAPPQAPQRLLPLGLATAA